MRPGGRGDYKQAIAAARSAGAVFERESDTDRHLRAVTLTGTCLAEADFPLDAIDEMAELAARHDPPATLEEVRLHEALARAHMLVGQTGDSLRLAEVALAAAERLEAIEVVAGLLITRAAALAEVGRPQESVAVLRGVLVLAESRGLNRAVFRAINNLCVALFAEDELTVDALNRESWQKAKAVGDPVWMRRAGFDLASSEETAGRFEEVRMIEAQLGDRLPASVTNRFRFLSAFTRFTRGEIEIDEAVSTLSQFETSQDPQLVSVVAGLTAVLRLFGGDFEMAWSLGMAAPYAYGYPLQLEIALLAAIWADDDRFVSEAAEAVGAFDRPGRMIDALQDLAVAATAQRAGRQDEAATICRRVLSEVSATFRPLRAATVAVTVARLLGIEHPIGAEAAADAHRTFTDQGRSRLLAVFAEALPQVDVEAVAG